MAVAKLYDRGDQAVTMKTMLLLAAKQRATFQADAAQVSATILRSTQRIVALQPILDSIRKRRDKWLAHLDVQTVRSPAALNQSAKLTIEDLEKVLQETEDIFSEVEYCFNRIVGKIRFLGADDYKAVLNHIRHGSSASR